MAHDEAGDLGSVMLARQEVGGKRLVPNRRVVRFPLLVSGRGFSVSMGAVNNMDFVIHVCVPGGRE